MHKKISGAAYDIAFDETNGRFFLLSERSVRVFHVHNHQKIATLQDIANPNQIIISPKNGMIAVKSTTGAFAFYSLDSLKLLGCIRLSGDNSTDSAFYYDEEENALYGITHKGLTQWLYRVFPEKLSCSEIPLPKAPIEPFDGEKPVTRYTLHKYTRGEFYLLCDVYDVGCSRRIYECSYGRYALQDQTLVCREKYQTTNEHHLSLLDITEPMAYRRFLSFCNREKLASHTVKSYRKDGRLFFITHQGVYREEETETFQTVYQAEYISDYAEFQGRRYICTWNWCLIEE